MSGLVFLLIALAISLVGSLVLWLRSRKPKAFDSGVDEFRREMRALAPDASGSALAHERAERRGRAAG